MGRNFVQEHHGQIGQWMMMELECHGHVGRWMMMMVQKGHGQVR